MGIVTQLGEGVTCRLIGYSACLVQFVCREHSAASMLNSVCGGE